MSIIEQLVEEMNDTRGFKWIHCKDTKPIPTINKCILVWTPSYDRAYYAFYIDKNKYWIYHARVNLDVENEDYYWMDVDNLINPYKRTHDWKK